MLRQLFKLKFQVGRAVLIAGLFAVIGLISPATAAAQSSCTATKCTCTSGELPQGNGQDLVIFAPRRIGKSSLWGGCAGWGAGDRAVVGAGSLDGEPGDRPQQLGAHRPGGAGTGGVAPLWPLRG